MASPLCRPAGPLRPVKHVQPTNSPQLNFCFVNVVSSAAQMTEFKRTIDSVTDTELAACLEGLPSLATLEVEEIRHRWRGNTFSIITAPLLQQMIICISGP